MTDYYSLIAGAVVGLIPNTRQARRSIYDRELANLLAQLSEVRPALSKFDVTRARLEFEAAVRKFEAEQGTDKREKTVVTAETGARVAPQEGELLRRQEEEARRLQRQLDLRRVLLTPEAEEIRSPQRQFETRRARLTPEEEQLLQRIQQKLGTKDQKSETPPAEPVPAGEPTPSDRPPEPLPPISAEEPKPDGARPHPKVTWCAEAALEPLALRDLVRALPDVSNSSGRHPPDVPAADIGWRSRARADDNRCDQRAPREGQSRSSAEGAAFSGAARCLTASGPLCMIGRPCLPQHSDSPG
jgi:hypothetical protein